MKIPTYSLLRPSLLTLLSTLFLLPNANSANSSPRLVVTCQPPSHVLAMEFTKVTLDVQAEISGLRNPDHAGRYGLLYDWRRTDRRDSVQRGTNSAYTIPRVLQPASDKEPRGGTHVGTYTVTVTAIPLVEIGAKANESRPVPEIEPATSSPIHLSVYRLTHGESSGGVLTFPIGQFTAGGAGCNGDSSYNLWNVYTPFYGPGWGENEMSLPFVNVYGETNLVVKTCLRSNNPHLETCVQIQPNFYPMTPLTCLGASGPCVTLTNCGVEGLLSRKTYRVGIFAKSGSTNSVSTVSFMWTYTDYAIQ